MLSDSGHLTLLRTIVELDIIIVWKGLPRYFEVVAVAGAMCESYGSLALVGVFATALQFNTAVLMWSWLRLNDR